MEEIPALFFLFIFGPLGLVGAGLLWFINYREQQRLLNSGIDKIDQMSGLEFERYLQVLFQKLGHQVVLTPYSRDFGADLIIIKNNLKTAVQAKRHKSWVGIEAVQQVVAAKAQYNCQQAMVITNCGWFTKAAQQLAKANNVTLWDRQKTH